ncbi:hypothetical protein [Methylobacterium nodulans]|uniref:Uncharacterized protein n=1 Tax=Methylobacterium nodulans (strain LMG 21967 / CNCM I-2342 / ORS 2060) TaxID=460265 RepID=B8IKT7_METNO|nr:hypothetical protein [Methylobacterium nodulans]ACL56294.1 conserved hypothetical protein [Methylobacterium nodulans ORS 2060]
MRTIVLGLATLLGAATLASAPAAALPVAGPGLVAPEAGIAQAQYVERRIVRRGPRCTVVVNKRRGPYGRVVVTRTRRCF